MNAPSTTPRGLRPHICLTGAVNAGKSSLLNALTGHDLAIVSSAAGTTTDPVRKATELVPFGPVVFVDTAGSRDSSALAIRRHAKTRRAVDGADLVVYVLHPANATVEDVAEVKRLRAIGRTVVPVFTHADVAAAGGAGDASIRERIATEAGCKPIDVSAVDGTNVAALRERIIEELSRQRSTSRTLLEDLVRPFRLILLIVPIDLEAPAGRLILPQVQTIREVLDGDAATLVVKDREVSWVLDQLKRPPDLAITDSQVVLKAAGAVPPHIPLTTFSILFSRFKGDLNLFVRNARRIDGLRDGSRVLVAESCSHHTHCDDIGRVKIPRWLRQYTGRDLVIDTIGGDFPDDIDRYDLLLHCGGCMITRAQMHARMRQAIAAGAPVTNYGVAISHLHGVLDRVLEPFAPELVG